jgi:hypothetical protein
MGLAGRRRHEPQGFEGLLNGRKVVTSFFMAGTIYAI